MLGLSTRAIFFSFQTQLRFCLNKVAHNGVGRVEFGELSEGNGPFTIRLLFEKSAKKLLSFDIALHLCWGSAILLPYMYFKKTNTIPFCTIFHFLAQYLPFIAFLAQTTTPITMTQFIRSTLKVCIIMNQVFYLIFENIKS